MAFADLFKQPTSTAQPTSTWQPGDPVPFGWPNGIPPTVAAPTAGTAPLTQSYPNLTQVGTQVMGGTGTPQSGTGALGDPSNYQNWWNSFLSSKGSPASSYDLIKQWAPELQQQGIKVNYNLSGDPSKLIFPNGDYYSVVDQNGQWRFVNTSANAGGGSGGGGSSASWSPDPRSSDFYNMLMGRASISTNVDPNDPIIKNQTNAFGAQQENQRREYLQGLAEKQGPNANIDAESRLTASQAGQATGGFQANLMGRELQARRDQIQQTLQLQGAFLSDEQRMQLSWQLAQMNDALQRAGLAQRAFEFDTNNQNTLAGY